MQENPNYYSIMTADVRYDKEISAAEKIMYSEITALANKNGYCNASNKYFAELYEVHKDTISRWINTLKERGHLEVELVYKGKRVMERRIYPIGKNADRYRQKCRQGIGKNAEENIINNNINNKEEERNKIVDFYNQNFNLITQYIFENIETYLIDGLESELILEAMKEAVSNNVRKWNYVKTILDDCLNSNIYTKEQYLIHKKEYKEKQKLRSTKPKEVKKEVKYNTDFSEYDKYVKRDDDSG